MAKKTASKKKTAKKVEPEVEPVRSYTVAKCQWCGMQWKHFGEETPPHYCGKGCEEHERTSRELAIERATNAESEEEVNE